MNIFDITKIAKENAVREIEDSIEWVALELIRLCDVIEEKHMKNHIREIPLSEMRAWVNKGCCLHFAQNQYHVRQDFSRYNSAVENLLETLKRYSASKNELKLGKISLCMFPQKLKVEFDPIGTKALKDLLSEMDGVDIYCDDFGKITSFEYVVLVNEL